MANEAANAKKQKFIDLLHELFQLNQPELDFGLYRIMHAKSGQIKAFIENDLAREIDEAFAAGGDDKVAELKAAYEQARTQAKEFGIDDPDANPKVKESKEAYAAAREGGDDPSDIYDHLYRFFSRYYDKGDFLSRRYHVAENDSRAAPYAVPYDGREVYLHWANKDQYYIKSSEYLSNFSFDLAEALKKERERQGAAGQGGFDFESDGAESLKVTFQLVDAVEGTHNNVKDNQSRFFIIHAENPVEIHGDELIINFEYRPDPDKSGQEGTWQKKRLDEAESVILNALKQDDKPKPFLEALAFLAPTEKQKDRTLLGKYLASYTARNTMDYFIHKDLGSFLRRELDFYIKNEIMRLDDLSVMDVAGVTRSLKKISALRTIARQIIDFLAQLEEFQKKLWLKKKFVTEVNYCITLDRVPAEFYEEIAANERQWAQWEELGFLTKDTERTKEILAASPYMTVDTALFEGGFKARLLAEIEGLDEQCDGVLVHSENFQALNLFQEKYQNSVSATYIDPPYNTGNDDGFCYRDGFRESSWLAMLTDRLALGRALSKHLCCVAVSIDDYELHNLTTLMQGVLGMEELAKLVWDRNRKNDARFFSVGHEYMLVYTDDKQALYDAGVKFREPKDGLDEARKYFLSIKRKYSSDMDSLRKAWLAWFDSIPVADPRYKLRRYSKVNEKGPYRDDGNISWPGGGGARYEVIHPATGKSVPVPKRGWVFPTPERFWEEYEAGRVVFGPDHTTSARIASYLFDSEEQVMPSVFYSYAQTVAQEFHSILGEKLFDNPKNWKDVARVLRYLSNSGVVLDYFAGSGTTAHAVINLNRQEGGDRKYVLVEMGNYFDTVLKPRIQKIVFSEKWKEGRPAENGDALESIEGYNGISHCFKYLRLESYEDTLNNLSLEGSERHADMLAQEGNARLCKEYLLYYFLDVETRGSASLLNVEQFRDPTAYTLMVKKPGSDAQAPVKVDLIETFNWLIGLEVALLDRLRTYAAEFEREKDPELPEDQHTRLKVTRFKEISPSPQPSPARGEGAVEGFWFRVVEGYVRRTPGSDADKERVMVVWRKLTDDPEQDAAALEALLEKYHVNQADSEFDKIYINGPHGLSLSGQAKARLLSLEETFMARMWEGTV